MPLEKIEFQTAEAIDHSIIWLHGLGADGHDFLPIAEELNLRNTRFTFPHAPYRTITINNGYEMRAWYDLFGLTIDSPQDETGIRATQQLIQELVDQEIARGVPSRKIILAGFSQGGAIALHTALRSKVVLGGVLALSTYLPLKQKLSAEITDPGLKTPILMTHGRYDDVIRLETAQLSKAALEDTGCNLYWKEYPMAHSVCAEEIADIRDFLLEVLKP